MYLHNYRSCQTSFDSRGVLPYKGLMGTYGQPGYVYRDFCLQQGIEFIIFCLKWNIFSWTINSKTFTSSCKLILTSVDFGNDISYIKFPLITQQESGNSTRLFTNPLTASQPKQMHSRAKSLQLRRLPRGRWACFFLCEPETFDFLVCETVSISARCSDIICKAGQTANRDFEIFLALRAKIERARKLCEKPQELHNH